MSVGLRLSTIVALVVAFLLLLLTLQCVLALLQPPVPHGAWRAGFSTIVVTGVWWLLNGPIEGRTLLSLTHTHGLTLADVAGLPSLLLGGAVLALAVLATL